MSEAIVYHGTKSEQREYTAKQFFNNTITASFAFTTATSGLGKLVGKLGGKTVDNTFNLVEKNLEAGKNPMGVAEDMLNFAQKDIEIEPNFRTAFGEAFPETALEEGATLRGAYEKMMDDVGTGKIKEADVSGFMSKLDEAGFPLEKLSYFTKEWGAKYSDDFVNKANESLNSKHTDIGYDVEAEQAMKDVPDSETVATRDYDTELVNTAKDVKIEDEVFSNKVSEIEAESKTHMEALQSVGDCLMGSVA
jgi:hypothetical protein